MLLIGMWWGKGASIKGEFFIFFQGCFFFLSLFLFKREIALFSNLYMRTLAPGRRQKTAKVKPDLRMKDALLIKLASCSCREATHTQGRTQAPWLMCTQEHTAQHTKNHYGT